MIAIRSTRMLHCRKCKRYVPGYYHSSWDGRLCYECWLAWWFHERGIPDEEDMINGGLDEVSPMRT